MRPVETARVCRQVRENGDHPDQRLRLAAYFTGIALVLLSVLPARASETHSFSFDGSSLTVANLIGSIEVVEGSGSEFKVSAEVRGEGSSKASIDFDQSSGRSSRLTVGFPVSKYRKYVYPGYRGRTTLSRSYSDNSSLLGRLLSVVGSGKVQISGRGSGLELWVDLVIEVPTDGTLKVEHGVGDIAIQGVTGDLSVSSRSGQLTGNSIVGDSIFDLGSGSVSLANVKGELLVDTGSGSVVVEDCQGPALTVDTGSGSVSLSKVRTRVLNVDTGSGSVHAEGIATENAVIDTGSGDVRLVLTEMGDGDFSIDTGSGEITLLLPDYASAAINAETGSGGIDVALDNLKLLHRERNQMRFKVGKGAASVDLDTGSGGIRIAALEQ